MSTTTRMTDCEGGPCSRLNAAGSYKRPPLPDWVDLRLNSNEGQPPAADLLQRITSVQADELLCRYPQRNVLEEQIARRLSISPDRVIVTAGGDDAIDRICRAYLGPDREIILPVPTFEMIERYATLANSDITRVSWPGSAFPTNEILATAGERTAVITVVSPNNPTGAVATREDIETLATRLPNVLVLVDLAYCEFADNDLTSCALKYPNCVVIRSMSKAWGLAGLRVGYAAGAANVIASLRAAGGPYAVSGLSLTLASRALDECGESIDRRVARVRQERSSLTDLLIRLGEKPSPSQANFVWCRFRDAAWVEQALRSLGIAVRRFPDNKETADYLRISCPGDDASFSRLCQTLETALSPQAILFDMDGVLVDVSDSYRTAIIQTAAAFGVSLTPSDIANAKTQGDANNDWQLTTRLLRDRGCRVVFDEVKAQFETLYQGVSIKDGLWRRERFRLTRQWIEALSKRFTLGVVTGRPRADAERTLQTFGIRDLFQTLVCMEDAAAKPDPAPVRLAMHNLNATRGWLLGDTPDDIIAARSAGVLPIGIVAPGDKQIGRLALFAVGAAIVLNQPNELEDLLP